jgi:cytoskeletal protein CcmA (bactofilin family)
MFLKPNNSSQSSPSPKPNASKKAVPSVVSSDMHVLGNIVSEGSIDFDGTIDGNIRCASLVLRHNGKINGEIHADTVQVFGNVKGLIKAKSVQLHSTCCVEGIIMHEVISIEDGAVIDGKIKRTNKITSTPPTLAPEDEYEETDGSLSPKLLENIRLIAG